MAISVRSSSKNDSTTGTAMSVAAPTGATAGDLVVVIAEHNGNTTIVDNNGTTPFTEDINDWQPTPTAGNTISVFSRTIQTGDPSTYNFTAGTSTRWSCIAICLQATSPAYDVSPSTSNGGSTDDSASGTQVIPSITTGVANTLHIVFCGWDTSATGTITEPSGYTLLQSANAGGQPLSAAYKAIATASATGTTSYANTEFAARAGLSFSVKESATAVRPISNLLLMSAG